MTDAPEAVRVSTPDGSYGIEAGPGLLEVVGERLRESVASSCAVLMTDTNVERLLGDVAQASLEASGFAVVRSVVEAGERAKSWRVAGGVLESWVDAGVDRGDAVVALGGGVVGDLAGFCASTYMRGIPYLQAPTTLLAQVDASIGGKTGVDMPAGKNLVGTFWQPVAVVSDTSVLETLDDREWACGLAEIVKHAVLAGPEEFGWAESEADALAGRGRETVARAVRMSIEFKAGVVSQDVREVGSRACLNLGHTFAHAIEAAAGYDGLSHGIAVGEGLRFAAFLGEKALGTGPGWRRRQESLLDAVGVPRPAGAIEPGVVFDAMKSDKKARGGTVRFVLASEPGSWQLLGVDDDMLRSALEEWNAVEAAARRSEGA